MLPSIWRDRLTLKLLWVGCFSPHKFCKGCKSLWQEYQSATCVQFFLKTLGLGIIQVSLEQLRYEATP